MAYPASIDALRAFIQDSDGVQTESYTIANPYTYRLGANASPVFPAGVQLVPHGAPALPSPAAPTLGAHLTSGGHFLTTGQVYKYAVAARTKWGLTAIGSQLSVTPTGIGVTIAVAAAPVSLQNPATSLVLCRSKAAGSTLYVVRDLGTTNAVTVADGAPDDDLTVLAPTSDSSGLASPVAVTAPGPITYTEKVQGATLTGHDYSVDYTYGATGGVVTFASADVGVTVSIAYTAAALDTAALLNLLVTALKDIAAATHIQPSTASNAAMADYSADYAPLGTLTDARGSFTMATASGAAFVRFTFHDAYPATPIVTVTPLDAATAAAHPYVSARSTTGFTVTMGIPGTTGTTFNLEYLVVA